MTLNADVNESQTAGVYVIYRCLKHGEVDAMSLEPHSQARICPKCFSEWAEAEFPVSVQVNFKV